VTFLSLKVTLLMALVLTLLPMLSRASASLRHLVCVCGLAGALLLPLAMLIPLGAPPIPLPPIAFVAVSGMAAGTTGWPVGRILTALWAGGSVAMLTRLAFGYWRVSEVLRTAAPGNGFVFADVSVPLVSGLRRAVVMLPRAAQDWPPMQVNAAIRHEVAHLDRKDVWTSLMAHLACAIYWFHPLVWAVAARLREEQETACDDAVLGAGFEPAFYAEALIATASNITSNQLIGCHMLTHTTLKSRIARLFATGLPRMSSASTLRRTALGLSGVVAIIAMLNVGPQARAQQDPAANPVSMGEGITGPRLVYKVEPGYTDEARAAKIQGAVKLSLVVGTDGLAHDINVVSGLDGGLDLKAVEAVQKWRFAPGSKDGEPVAVRAQIEINFKLL